MSVYSSTCLSFFTKGFSSARLLLSLTYTELLVYECATLSSGRLLGVSQGCEKWLLASSCLPVRLSVRMQHLGSHWCIFMKFNIWTFFENLLKKIEFNWNLTHNDQCKFLIISRSIIFRTRNIWDIRCREKQNTHFMFNNFYSKIWGLGDNL